MAKPVLILVGSESDRERVAPAMNVLDEAGIGYDFVVSSAHRNAEQTAQIAKGARARGLPPPSRARSPHSPTCPSSDSRSTSGRCAGSTRCTPSPSCRRDARWGPWVSEWPRTRRYSPCASWVPEGVSPPLRHPGDPGCHVSGKPSHKTMTNNGLRHCSGRRLSQIAPWESPSDAATNASQGPEGTGWSPCKDETECRRTWAGCGLSRPLPARGRRSGAGPLPPTKDP
jgi:hypothetical protein